jgi:penicillin-insensitive murein endopeptidase
MRILHQKLVHLAGVALFAAVTSAPAQDLGTLNPTPLPPLANPDSPKTLAKELFARKATPLPGIARSIGTYNDGCLAGGVELPITGPGWQVMRVSRNRWSRSGRSSNWRWCASRRSREPRAAWPWGVEVSSRLRSGNEPIGTPSTRTAACESRWRISELRTFRVWWRRRAAG